VLKWDPPDLFVLGSLWYVTSWPKWYFISTCNRYTNFVDGDWTCLWPGQESPRRFQCVPSGWVCAAVINRLGKLRKTIWPAAVAGAQGQGKGASSGRHSYVQLEHGITSGATLPVQLSLSLSPTRAILHHQCSHNPEARILRNIHRHACTHALTFT